MSLITSCSDFLGTDPFDFVAPDNFYQNETECNQALTGVYYTLATEDVYGNRYSLMMSNIDDLSFYSRNNHAGQVYGNDHNASNSDIYRTWAALYAGINNSNLLLEKLEGASMDNERKKVIEGEARFLRAYYHFLLAQAWYEVPMRTKTLDNITEGMIAATPHVEMIDWIIDEMQTCVDLVDNSEYDLSPSRIKQNTVYGILARVNLWRAGYPCNGGKLYYERASNWALKVKESNKHSLNPDVYALWKCLASNQYDREYNESIWEVEFLGTRLDGTYTYGRIGSMIGNWQLSTLTDGNGYGYGFYNGSLILWDKFEEHDKRRDLTIAPYYFNVSDTKINWGVNNIIERRCGKFRREWEASVNKDKNYPEENYPILRYADILLMIAEAQNEVYKEPSNLAYECINEVRTRAGLDPVSNLGYVSFQNTIRDERARELCFESLRKYDLVRWGSYYLEVNENLNAATYDSRWTQPTSYYYGGARLVSERTQRKHMFLPIPSTELGVNNLLEQNPYWK